MERNSTVNGALLDRSSSETLPRARKQTSAIVHLAVLAAFVLPITFVPYLFARHRMTRMQRQLEEARSASARVQSDLRTALLANASMKEEHVRIRSLLHHVKEDTEKMKAETTRKQNAYIASDTYFRNEIKRLIDDRRRISSQATVLRELGTCLADVAAFMEEVELEQGLVFRRESHRIDRLRSLALKLENMLPVALALTDEQGTDTTDNTVRH